MSPKRTEATVVNISLQDGLNGYTGTRDTDILVIAEVRHLPRLMAQSTTLSLFEREHSFTNASRVLISYDLSGITPATLTVTNASLTLKLQAYAFGTFSTPTSLYLVSAADAVWTEAQATYINAKQSTTTPWAGGRD